MSSFLEKLKKGMSIKEPISQKETEEKQPEEILTEEKPAKNIKKTEKVSFQYSAPKIEKVLPPKEIEAAKEPEKETVVPELKIKKIEIETKIPEKKEITQEPTVQKKQKWSFQRGEEGQLVIDVYQTENELVIQSAVAGVKPENLDITVEKDILTIKGSREKQLAEKGDYFVQECFWGFFSREIILPVETDPSRIKAEMKNGVLTIKMPKIIRENKKKIVIKE